jgi:hypothetical protein
MLPVMLRKEKHIYYILRIACAMCFIGHGAFGIIGKVIWCNYFALFGIGQVTAHQFMPVLGSVDILMGFTMLVYPLRAIVLWLAIWGLLTAALRPLSGEPFPELLERAGNFGAPTILLILCGAGRSLSSWFTKMNVPAEDRPKRLKIAMLFLRYVAFLLLAGHGWLNLAEKTGLIAQYNALGFHDAHSVAIIAGTIEIAMALSILIKPVRSTLMLILIWKVATELFYPHWEAYEWIERGCSYGSLLALWLAIKPEIDLVSNNCFSLNQLAIKA